MPSASHSTLFNAIVPNAVPVAAFTSSTNNLTVTVNGSTSTDSDGTIASYSWNFGDSGSGTGVTTSHTYASAGTYSIVLTVTDNGGATDTQTNPVTVTAASQQSATGDQGVNRTGNAGQQQTGATQYQSLSGSDMQAKATAAGITGMSFAAGTFAIPKFSGSGTSGIGVNFPTGMKSLLGAGSASTVLAMPAGTDNGTHSNSAVANSTTAILLTQWESAPDGWVIDGINLQGTDQGTSANSSVDGLWYHGLQMDNMGSGTISNTTISGVPGNSGSPPSETFGLSLHSQAAGKTINVTNCTFDGKRVSDSKLVGAAICGTNTSRGIINFTDCLFENTGYSAGLAIWELATGGTINLIRPVFKNCHRNLGNEAQGGTINIYDPVFGQPTVSNEDDIRITWSANYNNGTINLYFSTAAKWTACMAGRNSSFSKLKSQVSTTQVYNGTAGGAYSSTNQLSQVQSCCHVYIGDGNGNYTEQTLSNYWTVG